MTAVRLLKQTAMFTWLLFIVCSLSTGSLAQKLTSDEVIARHLESIGSAKARAAIATRIISGTSQVIFRTTPAGQAIGKAVLASEEMKNLFGMSFPSPVYPREQFAYNGVNFMAAFATPGTRSLLGSFLMTNDVIFKQGLMCGTLSSAWPLLDTQGRGAQLNYLGTKKIDNHLLHEVRYTPSGTSDLKITIYFDSETFRHVRT